MRDTLIEIDRLLRGGCTADDQLAEGRLAVSIRRLTTGGLTLAALYGICMGLFAALRHEDGAWRQMVFAAIKVPLLLFLTLGVTMPSLYVFSALARSSLRFTQTLAVLLACTAVTATVLASLGPVTVFFTLSTESYTFMLLLNVFVFALAIAVGLGFLCRVSRVALRTAEGRGARAVFTLWLVIYGFVGAQMSWILRPYVGDPALEVTFVRETESHFFRGLLDVLRYAVE